MSYGAIYDSTWWGNGVIDNDIYWGIVYYDLAQPSEVPNYLRPLEERSAYYENVSETTLLMQSLEDCECQNC